MQPTVLSSNDKEEQRCPMCGAACSSTDIECGACGESLQIPKGLAVTHLATEAEKVVAYAAIGIPLVVVILAVIASLL